MFTYFGIFILKGKKKSLYPCEETNLIVPHYLTTFIDVLKDFHYYDQSTLDLATNLSLKSILGFKDFPNTHP